MRIIRVFPKRNNYTPADDMVFIGNPPFIIPEHDEVHISCTFTWDRQKCKELQKQWQARTDKEVRIGGVAFGSPTDGFVKGRYIKSGVVFTSRGCNNNCPWCIVPKVEGRLKELPAQEGNIIQDNNFLQTNRSHKEKVFEMLKKQKKICFKGGLEAGLIDDHFITNIQGLSISELWLACDTDGRIKDLQKACEKLSKAGFNRNKINCYVLSKGTNRDKDEARARAVYEAGAMPFVQLFRDFTDEKTEYSKDWNRWARSWQRPAAIKAHMEKGTSYKDFYK